MKVDVEGMEPYVMSTVYPLMQSHRVHNIFLEFSPALTGKPGLPSKADLVTMLQKLQTFGYSVYEIPWSVAKTEIRVEDNWDAGSKQVLKHIRHIEPSKFESFTLNFTAFNTNFWFCLKTPAPGSRCGGCPA